MRVFVIPSWYPSLDQPHAGIFFQEQAQLYARYFPEDQVGLVSWGQNDSRLLLEKRHLLRVPSKVFGASKIKSQAVFHADNCIDWFYPCLTWTRKVARGNINAIINACEKAFQEFTDQFGKPDIIHAHVSYPGGFIAWKLSERHQLPFIITEHMGPFPFPSFRGKGGLSHLLTEPLQHADKTLVVSVHLQREMAKFNLKSSVFHNFIDDDFFNVVPQKRETKVVRLLHIGRMAPEKRQSDLLTAVAMLPTSIDFQLSMVGDGELKNDLVNQTKELGIVDRVVFKGVLNRVQLCEQLHEVDVVILSSNYENFPVSILEALACGKPVAATKCGGTEEMINPVNGVLAKVLNPKDLAGKILQVISRLKEYSPDAIRQDFYSRYGKPGALTHLKRIYQEVVEDYHSR